MKRLGLDIGSTTLKAVLIDEEGKLLYKAYKRHFSKISETAVEVLKDIVEQNGSVEVLTAFSGSAGMGVAEALGMPFEQEVYAERTAVNMFYPQTDAVIELGGEDAKMLFLTGGFEMRMNGSCAGGTGAFIDQMATLMKTTPDELNELSAKHERICTIASRCGVFAKSDIQPLLNQGVRKEDISAGIFYAVANQTIAGLAQGRRIKGNVLYLGGPLTFLSQLREAFDDILGIKGLCPDNSLYYVAMGAAVAKTAEKHSLGEIIDRFEGITVFGKYESCKPLFVSQIEYEAFCKRHKDNSSGISLLQKPASRMHLGIDAGSTTLKILLCDDDGNIFKPFYATSHGRPVEMVAEYLKEIYGEFPDINIVSSAVTGYGEDMVRSAFNADFGIVETIAHYTAAKKFKPDVDFILDIGGQDIKCFKIRNGLIEYLYLNEACSSGCGSFLQTFASSLGYTVEDFAKIGLFADAPVNLGSRCTVFMNSSVKQAQKDGASIENISAGLSISVVKNALYKVIRCAKPEELGKNIVVQGGTFLNDCVLRAFEQEIGTDVIRPEYSALMGAYGAALYAKEHFAGERGGLISAEALMSFTHTVKYINCSGCGNHCALTLNSFANGKRFIAGNKCSKPLGKKQDDGSDDMYSVKLKLLEGYMNRCVSTEKINIGLPLGLNMFELLPFWSTFFNKLGFNVVTSPLSTREIYSEGQYSIPSDTACYPAKLMHGHIEELLKKKVQAIFYPCMSYNLDEGRGVDHYNCPVVAYYPQVIKLNVDDIKNTAFIWDFISLANKDVFCQKIKQVTDKYFSQRGITKKEIRAASDSAYKAYFDYMREIEKKADEIIKRAEAQGKPIIILSGRPYHLDPEINHGINELLRSLGGVVISEDGLPRKKEKQAVKVRNQWTYHARLYSAAQYVANAPDSMNISLVQLVSFGCGLDAVTTDEVREITEAGNRLYTQIKIDEISNTGAVTIRLRSLLSVMEDKFNKEKSR